MTSMPRRVAGAAVALATGLATGGVLGWSAPAHAANASVSATSGNVFEPGRVVVNVGDSVTWTTTGGVNHTVTSSTPNWEKDDSIPVPGRSTTYTFRAPGQYNYFCETHGTANSGMRGVVVVNAPPRPAPSPTRPATATPRPTATRTPTVRPSPSATRAPTVRPSPSAPPTATPRPTPSRSAAPAPSRTASIGTPTLAPPRSASPTPPAPLPTVAEEPSAAPLVDLGSGGLGPRPTTGRGRGLPAFLAVVALVGVVSAQVRALLALPTDD